MFVGAAGLAPAEKGVDEGLEQVRAAETLDHDPFIPDIEGLDRVASGMQNLAAGPELFGEELRETPQAFRGGIDVNAHDRKNLCCKVTPPGVTLLVLFDCEVVLKRKRVPLHVPEIRMSYPYTHLNDSFHTVAAGNPNFVSIFNY